MIKLLQFFFFVSIGYFLTSCLLGKTDSKNPNEVTETKIDFTLPKESNRWQIINDGVMGGLSQSQVSITKNNSLLFKGNVSLENYGGFASVRSKRLNLKIANARKVKLKVKGDGKIYQLRFRTNNNYDGISYKHDFETLENEWVEIELPFEDFVATFRGRILDDEPELNPANIEQIAFLIAEKQEGLFRLEVDWVDFE